MLNSNSYSNSIIHTGSLNQLSETIDWGLIDFAIPTLWEKNQGENVTILVADSGLTHHIDLEENILWDKAMSFIPNEDIIDLQGHGTNVAGIIAAKKSDFGIVGVAPKSKIIPVKVLSNKVSSTKEKTLEKCLEYALKVKPDIINMSLGSEADLSDEFKINMVQLYRLNIPIVCAIGNNGFEYACFPAIYQETISAGSYDKDHNVSTFSSKNSDIDFVLPGEEILTTSLNNNYSIVKGTSFSTPFLSGIIAIIISEFKKNNIKYTIEDIRNLLAKSCKDYGPVGKDPSYGYGIIDINVLKNLF